MSKRKQTVAELGPCPRGFDTLLAVQVERVSTLEHSLPEMKLDIKEILKSVNRLTINVAAVPKWENLREVESRVELLETTKSEVSGGWKVLMLLGTVVGTVVGWVVSIFFSGGSASATQHITK